MGAYKATLITENTSVDKCFLRTGKIRAIWLLPWDTEMWHLVFEYCQHLSDRSQRADSETKLSIGSFKKGATVLKRDCGNGGGESMILVSSASRHLNVTRFAIVMWMDSAGIVQKEDQKMCSHRHLFSLTLWPCCCAYMCMYVSVNWSYPWICFLICWPSTCALFI